MHHEIRHLSLSLPNLIQYNLGGSCAKNLSLYNLFMKNTYIHTYKTHAFEFDLQHKYNYYFF
jgi:hypothetical protein